MSLTQLSEKLITVLPPAFLILVLLNIGFLGMTVWTVRNTLEVFQQNVEVRNAMISRIVDACLVQRQTKD